MAKSFSADVHGMEKFASKIEHVAGHFHREVDIALLKVGEQLKEEAKTIAANAGSASIPPSLSVTAAPRVVVVRASAELAGLWELGNKNSSRSANTFRHPVFGNRDVWVSQPRHRFMAPALTLDRAARMRGMSRAVRRAFAAASIEVGR